jgi:hypothetical protein
MPEPIQEVESGLFSNVPDWLQIQECYRVLKRAKSNIVWEILRQSPPFVQWDHYPKGDVFDNDSHAQYYYHAHPTIVHQNNREENGHFHLFIRRKGIPAELAPKIIDKAGRAADSKEDDVCHLIAISMDKHGYPRELFTTNRWVTGETWYDAHSVIQLLDYFNIDHTYPSWPVNLWISSMVRVYKQKIIDLLLARDQVLERWQSLHPQVNAYEDRNLEVTSVLTLPAHHCA